MGRCTHYRTSLSQDASTNPYGLGDGVKYYMLEVEDWTQPSSTSKRRTNSKKTALSANVSEAASPAGDTPESTPGPPDPDAEVEEAFPYRSGALDQMASRARGSSASTAGPSSLSRLLAQAPPESSVEGPAGPPEPPEARPPSRPQTPPPATPKPAEAAAPPQPPSSPSHTASTPRSGSAHLHHRSVSRASHISSSSRFSGGRLPFAGATAKASATTALQVAAPEQAAAAAVAGSSASTDTFATSPLSSSSLSPEGSPTEGLAGMLPHHQAHRRRTSSYQPARQSPLAPGLALPALAAPSAGVLSGVERGGAAGGLTARTRLASLASSWGVAFGRRKGLDSPGPPGASGTADVINGPGSPPARAQEDA